MTAVSAEAKAHQKAYGSAYQKAHPEAHRAAAARWRSYANSQLAHPRCNLIKYATMEV